MGILLRQGCSRRPRVNQDLDRENCVYPSHALWYVGLTMSTLSKSANDRFAGGFWDFTADLTFKDTAYTNEFLGAHTDNTYFTDPARLQLFHLLSHTDGHGGASLLVDGLDAARQLKKESQTLFRALTYYRHPWHASGNEDVCIQPSALAPVFSVHPDMKSVYQIRWNNYDRAPKSDWRIDEQRLWYEAAARYNELLTSEDRQIWTQLEPGTALSEFKQARSFSSS